eukprot:c27394_g3_i2 orf=272-1585(+)
MYKNQLQELAQRGSFGLPFYDCIREGPDHAPLFKAAVTFNGERFESKSFFSSLRQAEHAAAEVALRSLSVTESVERSPIRLLAATVLNDKGVYKSLLQEAAQRAGVKLPVYNTVSSGPSHLCLFTTTVEIAGMKFKGETSKTKKQAEKNSAQAAWSALKQLGLQNSNSLESLSESNEEQEQHIITSALTNAYKANENKCVTHASESMQLHSTCNSQAQKGKVSSTFPKVTIVPFHKSSAQTGDGSSPRVFEETNSNSVHNQHCKSGILTNTPPNDIGFPHPDHVTTSGVVRDMPRFAPASIASAGSGGSMVASIPILSSVIPSTSPRDVHPRHGKNRSKVEIITFGNVFENFEKDVAETVLPMQSSVNPMRWPPSVQWIRTDAQVDGPAIHNLDAESSLGLSICTMLPQQTAPGNGDGESKDETTTCDLLSRLKLKL